MTRSEHKIKRWDWIPEIWAIVRTHPWLLAGTIIPNVISPAIEPAQAWLTKSVLDDLTKGNSTFSRTELVEYIPLVLVIFVTLAFFKLVGEIVDKIFDERLRIDFQRIYFDRKPQASAGEDIARTLNDCDQARKIVDLIQKDIWKIVIGLPAVLLWQLSIAAEWLIPLVLAIIPTLILTLYFGPWIQNWSQHKLHDLASVSDAVGLNNRNQFHSNQESYFKSAIKFEFFKKTTDVVSELTQWLGLIVLLLISSFFPLIPDTITAGEIGAFIINLKLISGPIKEIGKSYTKVKESYPAILRVFFPGYSNNISLSSAPLKVD